MAIDLNEKPWWVTLIVGLVLLFRAVPGGFVPEEDQGYVLAALQLPDAASLERRPVGATSVGGSSSSRAAIANTAPASTSNGPRPWVTA